jgi:hypothetical protein
VIIDALELWAFSLPDALEAVTKLLEILSLSRKKWEEEEEFFFSILNVEYKTHLKSGQLQEFNQYTDDPRNIAFAQARLLEQARREIQGIKSSD